MPISAWTYGRFSELRSSSRWVFIQTSGSRGATGTWQTGRTTTAGSRVNIRPFGGSEKPSTPAWTCRRPSGRWSSAGQVSIRSSGSESRGYMAKRTGATAGHMASCPRHRCVRRHSGAVPGRFAAPSPRCDVRTWRAAPTPVGRRTDGVVRHRSAFPRLADRLLAIAVIAPLQTPCVADLCVRRAPVVFFLISDPPQPSPHACSGPISALLRVAESGKLRHTVAVRATTTSQGLLFAWNRRCLSQGLRQRPWMRRGALRSPSVCVSP